MTVTFISFWIPLMWAIIVALFWRTKMSEPVNNWWVCGLVAAVNFFFFSFAVILFLGFMVVKLFLKQSKDGTKSE